MADRLTGILLVGGASTRFGSPKARALVGGETLADRAWRLLGEACDERIAVGKGDEELPFPVLGDGVDEHAAIHGLVAGLRAATTDLSVVVPVDMPCLTPDALRALAGACRDVAIPPTGPLPGAYRKSALDALQSGERSIRRAIAVLDVVTVELPPELLVNVNTPADVDL
ncbi:MAG: molybdenum cofactor guanylyltransferase [Actinobacteria bacterium]|nr:molybdenum cofactor guanylyltransferase [Actinomycetota bacterium]